MPRHDIELTSPVDFLGPVCCSHPKPQILHSCCPLGPRDYHCMICVIESSNMALRIWRIMEHRFHVSYFGIAHLLQGIHFQHFIKVPRCLAFWVKHLFTWFSIEVMMHLCNFICLYLWNFKYHCWMHWLTGDKMQVQRSQTHRSCQLKFRQIGEC